jgi:uncharacterized protein
MKYLSAGMNRQDVLNRARMKSMIKAAFISVFLTGTAAFSQNLPEKPNPPRLVNDYANLLNVTEIQNLEHKLVEFNDSTSTQIAVVIVSDLQGLDKSEYATALGNKWGVGQKGKNNGVLVLVKPKTQQSKGEIFIASGYGAEGPLPDLRINDIIENIIIPNFRQGSYYAGIDQGTTSLMAAIRGEYTAEAPIRTKGKGGQNFGLILAFLFVGFFLFVSVLGRVASKNRSAHFARKGVPWWIWLLLLNSGSSRGSSWGNFSSGSGGFGGGGFGGFGGGSFGGGGAGGSW